MGPLVVVILSVAIQFGGLTGEGSSFAKEAPSPVSDQESLASITVMTFNLGNGLADPGDLVTYIRTIDADLVALLEVTSEIAEAAELELADMLPYMEIRGDGIPGQALLSRYPITSAQWLEFNPGRPDLFASVSVAGHLVDVLVAHPPPPEVSGVVVQPRDG
ncbi:MAG TPA: endonuclease/exonuclease/phosphatase family protein, partial [Thermomicrobiales bacterium]|nr:endonuclease/exonuclease/phosphatase family protein [Thermomicrobiales bacterium]